jgi:hypothetical protein
VKEKGGRHVYVGMAKREVTIETQRLKVQDVPS